MPELKITNARKEHICSGCGKKIKIGDDYYGEDPKQTIYAGIHNKKYCLKCYNK